jgi:uncharacterized membrane protein YidH (DUF202 family)
MDNMFFPIVASVIVLVLAGGGVMHLAMDFRHFNQVVAQCEEQGYIQNNTVRLICAKEK